jgi:hypothetical protein
MKGAEGVTHCATPSVRAWQQGPIEPGHKDDGDDHDADAHLRRGIGAAMLRAQQGHLEISYRDDQGLLRAHWKRASAT